MSISKTKLKKELWQKAEKALYALYGDMPDIRILNRFVSEKLNFEYSILLWDILGEIRLRAKENDYITTLPGTLSSCFAAYLLGTSDINPLPLHYLCPVCKRMEFVSDKALPWDMQDKPCGCGAMMRADGFDIPYEMNRPARHFVSLTVDQDFLKTAEEIIREQTSGLYRICKLTKPDFAILKFVLLPFNGEPDFEENIDTVDNKYEHYPQITITPCHISKTANNLYRATGIHFDEIAIGASKSFLSDSRIIEAFANGNIDNIPNFKSNSLNMGEALCLAKPRNCYDLLQFLGAMHGTNTWCNNAERLIRNGICSIGDIPAHRDDVFMLLRDKLREAGLSDLSFADYFAHKARHGMYALGGIRWEERELLNHLNLPEWFIPYVEKIEYMTSKSNSISSLRIALAFMWYKVNYPEVFNRIKKDFCV